MAEEARHSHANDAAVPPSTLLTPFFSFFKKIKLFVLNAQPPSCCGIAPAPHGVFRCRANTARRRQSRQDSGLVFEAKVMKTF